MTHISTAFKEKYVEGDHYSMTRIISCFFAFGFLIAFETYAYRGKEVNWPLITFGIVILLNGPIQALFAYLQQWISSKEGRELLTTAVHKVEETMLGGTPAAQTVKAAMTMSTETKEKG